MLQDLLFKRYGGASAEVLQLQWEDFIELLEYAMKQSAAAWIKERWVNGYQNTSLDEFKEEIGYRKNGIIEEKPIDDILSDLAKQF